MSNNLSRSTQDHIDLNHPGIVSWVAHCIDGASRALGSDIELGSLPLHSPALVISAMPFSAQSQCVGNY
jgi:hypothetical protein